jgi:CHASE3 domain sensor protein
MKKFLSNNWIVLIIGISFFASTFLAIRNNYIIERNHALQQQAELIKQRTQDILSQTMHGIDLGVRGYGLTHDEKLLNPYNEAIVITPIIFKQLDSLLTAQNYSDREKVIDVKNEVEKYISFSKEMIEKANSNDMEAFTEMLRQDRGYEVWAKYTEFATPLFIQENKLTNQSLQDYKDAIRSNIILQILIIILVLPMLYLFVMKVKRERAARQAVLQEVKNTDQTYVFNPGERESMQKEDINKRSIENVKQACEVIESIASGNYQVEWRGLNDANVNLNTRTLAGNLLNLRNRLMQVKQEDDKRNWVNEGLAKFSEIVRNNQNNAEELAVKCISFLAKYLNAQQGSLFIAEGEGQDKHLNLAACFAFDRKKWIEKRVEIGNGLIGQAYLEGEPILLREIPDGYTFIRSGLGDATPRCLVIVPMKYDRETIALTELASFQELEHYKVDFLQKAGEYLASAIVNTRITLKMKHLLQEGSMREQQMREREEELRQNMEELQATQEELVRRQSEVFNPMKKSA